MSRIAINTLPFDRGGGVTYLENILPELAETGDEYHIFVTAGDSPFRMFDTPNVQYHSVHFPTEPLMLRLFYEQFVLPILLWYYNIEVFYSPYGLASVLAPCPTVIAIRNPNPYRRVSGRSKREKLRYWLQRQLTRLSSRRASRVILVSEYTEQIVSEYFTIDGDKKRIVYHGINIDAFETPSRPPTEIVSQVEKATPYILCVSTIYRHKNYEVLIDGYAALPDALREQYSLLIAGGYSDEEYFVELRERVEKKAVEDRIIFLGQIDYAHMPYLYSNAELFVLPSKLETFGHPLLESMAAGTPVLAADSASIPEIVDDAGVLFNPDSASELAEQIERILTTRELAETLTERGNERVTDFSWEETAVETHRVLQEPLD